MAFSRVVILGVLSTLWLQYKSADTQLTPRFSFRSRGEYAEGKQHSSPWWKCENRRDYTYCSKPSHCYSYNISDGALHCEGNQNLTVLASYCATFNKDENSSIEAGPCVFNAGNTYLPKRNKSYMHNYLSLPMNLTELNEFMCSRLFNRKGTLCGKCKDGYYPLAYSFDMNCVKCPNSKSNWWKFLMVAFLPLTIFYFIVLLCRVNVTSSNLYGFVWYSQMVYTPRLARIFIITLRNEKHFQTAVRYMGLPYGWDLEPGLFSFPKSWYLSEN